MAAHNQLKILSGVIALIILGGAIVLMAYYWEKVLRPEKVAIQQVEAVKVGNIVAPPPDPGLKPFNAAITHIKAEEWEQARTQFYYLMRYYPDSSKYEETKRILGELNADLLLSSSPMPGKIQHTVRSGDYFTVLQRKYRTTIDFILRANGRTTHFVRVGDKLWVMPLEFAMDADLEKRTLTVYKVEEATAEIAAAGAAEVTTPEKKEVFFKEYQIVDVNLPPTVSVPYSTKVTSKPAWLGNKRATFEIAEYHLAQKWLQTSKVGVAIKAAPEDIESATEDRKMGILMTPSDMSELFTYVRVGAPLRLTK
ncbi:MAG: LysM peptidoglycan-binding domain-containing protein [Verrucomicrobiota bacterium]